MKFFVLLLLATSGFAQENAKNQGQLTQLSGTPDVVEVEDLKGENVSIEADGASFLVSVFSNSGVIKNQGQEKKQ